MSFVFGQFGPKRSRGKGQQLNEPLLIDEDEQSNGQNDDTQQWVDNGQACNLNSSITHTIDYYSQSQMEGGANGDNGGVPNVKAQQAGVAAEAESESSRERMEELTRTIQKRAAEGVGKMFQLKKRDWSNLYNFEPDSFTQKLRAMAQNSFETLFVIEVMLISFFVPSYVSIVFIFLSGIQLIPSSLKIDSRLKWANITQIMLFVFLIVEIIYKYLNLMKEKYEGTEQDAYHKAVQFYWAVGYDITVTTDEQNSQYSFITNASIKSFIYETCLAFAYLFNLIIIYRMTSVHKVRKENRMGIVMLQQEILARLYQSDSEEEDVEAMAAQMAERQRDAAQGGKAYRDKLKALEKQVANNYIDSYYFQSMSPTLFMLFMVCQVAQSMTFNQALDLPSLFMVLIMGAVYPFRKLYYKTYGFATLFLAYYISFILTIKVVYGVLVEIEFIQDFIAANENDFHVKWGRIIFGQQTATDEASAGVFREHKIVYNFFLFCCFYFCSAWRQSKFLEIRQKTEASVSPDIDFYSRAVYYFENLDRIHTEMDELDRCRQIKKLRKKFQKKYKVKKGEWKSSLIQAKWAEYKTKHKTRKARRGDMNKYLPTLVIWMLRIGLGLQSYMYHHKMSMFHLGWVLLSFICTIELTLYLTIVLMLPVYAWEFLMVYGLKIPYFNQLPMYASYGHLFSWEMKAQISEQFLYFAILALLFIAIGCFKLSFQHAQKDYLVAKISESVQSPEYSIWYKYAFYLFKYIHAILLLFLFYRGSQDLDNLNNLGFMIFFAAYSASEELYRRTSKVLTIFISFFLLGQYYFSLNYHQYQADADTMRTLEWLNFYQAESLPDWSADSRNIYFRYIPILNEWCILILMSLLDTINLLYQDRQRTLSLSRSSYQLIEASFKEETFLTLIKIKNVFNRLLIFVALVLMIFFIGKAQTNLINWGFWSLCVINFYYMAKTDEATTTIQSSINIARGIKYYSAIVLIIEILLLAIVGEGEVDPSDRRARMDELFEEFLPKFYKLLSLIGLRVYVDPGTQLTREQHSFEVGFKFTSYIAYLLLSIFIEGYHRKMQAEQKGEQAFKEKDYKNLFEYDDKEKIAMQMLSARRHQPGNQTGRSELSGQDGQETSRSGASGRVGIETLDEDGDKDGRADGYQDDDEPRTTYTKFDFLGFFEAKRYDRAFLAYRLMDYWPYFDAVATYGHLFTNLIIVVTACYVQVTMLMAFNIICVCLFYSLATVRIGKVACDSYTESGLQSQTSLKAANMITRKFKIGAFYEFLETRKNIWNVQFTVVMIALVIGFPTTIFHKYRDQLVHGETHQPGRHLEAIAAVERLLYWLYTLGIFKDHREIIENYFYLPMLAVLSGLVLEKQAINWLTNRMGCTYFKLQKYIELDLRKKAIDEKWPGKYDPANPNPEQINPPKYNPESYRANYYRPDFDYLLKRFTKSDEVGADESLHLDNDQRKNLDFVPYKVAFRIRDFITFTVKIAGRAKDLQIDDETRRIIEQMEDHIEKSPDDEGLKIDIETVPIFKKYKLRVMHQQIQEAVDKKYKISFFKGMQLLLEALILSSFMIAIVMKANVFSIIYLIFIYKYVAIRQKMHLLVRMVQYLAICFTLQYLLYLFNLTQNTCLSPYPLGLEGYPKNPSDDDLSIRYAIPVFFHYNVFRNLRLDYFLGIGVEPAQLESLISDFLCLYLISMYVLNFRNPILVSSMEKVFWDFPSMFEGKEKWSRLDPKVYKQVLWLYEPLPLSHPKYQPIRLDPSSANQKKREEQERLAAAQYRFAREYNDIYFDERGEQGKSDQNVEMFDVNYLLLNYVDLKCPEIFSDEKCREKKWEFKEQSLYFRIVKQGSMVVYITFHCFTILCVLLMAVMRQSLISLGYALILLPRMRDGSEVLMQREIHQDNNLNKVKDEIERLEEKISEEADPKTRKELEKELDENNKLRGTLVSKKEMSAKSYAQKQDEKRQVSLKQWPMIRVMQVWLLIYACIDFTLQIISQMPLIRYDPRMEIIGFRKVWSENQNNAMSYFQLINYNDHFTVPEGTRHFQGLVYNNRNFILQILNCIMISFISLQIEIFNSPGYLKFVTQTDGSMDLLVKLAGQKAKSLAYVYNNMKIRKIISFQRRREVIVATVEKLRKKLVRWRLFTGTTLEGGANKVVKSEQQENEQANKEDINSESQGEDNKAGINRIHSQQSQDQILRDDKEGDKDKQDSKQPGHKGKKGVGWDLPEQGTVELHEQKKQRKLSRDEAHSLHYRLAKEFVKQKRSKLNRCARFYLWLIDNFVEKIMFKNDRKELKKWLKIHGAGGCETECELERIMHEEAEAHIQHEYDNKEGAVKLYELLERAKGKGLTGKNLLAITDFDRKIKLNQMQRTWAFTRPLSMIFKYIEVLFYIVISNTQAMVYLTMMWSMYLNAGLVSIIYPFSIFAYAMLEENRPRMWYWHYIRVYTTCMLMVKFFFNLSIFSPWLEDDDLLYYLGFIRLGLVNYDDPRDLIVYMLPEVSILVMIMLNEIHLKLIGLFYEVEQDVETVQDGVQRNIEKGDEERVRQKKILSTNMQLYVSFQDVETQKKNYEMERELMLHEGHDHEPGNTLKCTQPVTPLPEERLDSRQRQTLKDLSQTLWRQARQFDIDQSSNEKKSQFDKLVKENVIQKFLENDALTYVEGARREVQKNFMTAEEFKDEHDAIDDFENISAGDFEEELQEKVRNRGDKTPTLGFFEKSAYFERIFPTSKQQKPGYDLYGSSTLIMVVLLIFILYFYSYIGVNNAEILDVKQTNDIFAGAQSTIIVFIGIIIVFERYSNRTDTKPTAVQNTLQDTPQQSSFFKEDEMFKRSATDRSMTVRLQTMKTTDLDIGGSASQSFLEEMYGEDDGQNSFDDAATTITSQQKSKYIMHLIILVVFHIIIFWWLPIKGNMRLYGQPFCFDEEPRDALTFKWGCKDFDSNPFLRAFYVIVCIYFALSALQIRYGFPQMKKPSSVLQYDNDAIALLGAKIYASVPFATEIRCLLDFVFSKTALDNFQYWQLWQYHFDLWLAKNDNETSYNYRVLGVPMTRLDKCLFGVLISSILLLFLVGPVLFFSEYGGFITNNPVKAGTISLQLIVSKNTSYQDLMDNSYERNPNPYNETRFNETLFMLGGEESSASQANGDTADPEESETADVAGAGEPTVGEGTADRASTGELTAEKIYRVYDTHTPFFRQYDEFYLKGTPYVQWTETRQFEANQIQEAVANEYSDERWLIDDSVRGQMAKDLRESMNPDNPNYRLTLRLLYEFERELPTDKETASGKQEKIMNFTNEDDMQTAEQIREFIDYVDCDHGQAPHDIVFYEAFRAEVILGGTTEINPLRRRVDEAFGGMRDLKLTFMCPDQFVLHESTGIVAEGAPEQWGRMKIVLFSLMVSGSVLAGLSPASFYTTFVLILGTKVKIIFLYGTWRGFLYETTHPDPIIKLIEACYMYRHEEDLIGEEDTYRMLQEIVRSPDLLKALSGSSLKGSTSPVRDRLKKKDLEYLERIEKLEQQNFDVGKLKAQFYEKHEIQP